MTANVQAFGRRDCETIGALLHARARARALNITTIQPSGAPEKSGAQPSASSAHAEIQSGQWLRGSVPEARDGSASREMLQTRPALRRELLVPRRRPLRR
jgi:hypothetical protein